MGVSSAMMRNGAIEGSNRKRERVANRKRPEIAQWGEWGWERRRREEEKRKKSEWWRRRRARQREEAADRRNA